VGLIDRNYNLIGQILEIFEDKRKNEMKTEYSVKEIADGQGYSKSTKKRMMN